MTDPVFVELKQLRRGHGLLASDVVERVGPALRRACGVSARDSAADARRKLTLKISQECGRLPEPLRQAAMVALALDRGSKQTDRRFLHQRVAELAASFNREPRTVLRRIDQALSMLAELMVEATSIDAGINAGQDEGWYTDSLTATLYMDQDPVRLVEERRIVATVDGLDEILISWSVSADPTSSTAVREISARASSGGRIVEKRRAGRSHVDLLMRLPEPISLGQRHEYTATMTLGPRQSIRPYYVVTPWRTCRSFRIRIHFGLDAPKMIWRISGLPLAAVADLEPSDNVVRLDSLGELQLDFYNLRLARSYGVGWQP